MRFLATLLGVIAATTPAAAQSPLVAGPPGVALSDAQVLSVELPITNRSTVATSSVTVTAAQLGGLPMVSPTLPDNLGNLAAGAATTFTVNFDASSVPAGTIGPLVVSGTYALNGVTANFMVQRTVSKPPASTQSHSASAPPNTPVGAPYPPFLTTGDANDILIPATLTGPSNPAPVPPPTDIENLGSIGAQGQGAIPLGATSPLQLYVNKNFGTPTTNPKKWPLDPNAATKGNIVLVTHNHPYLEYSTDGGSTFLELDVTTIFPNRDQLGNLIDGGMCCDQAVVYVPIIDRFVWVMQFHAGTTGKNRERLAAASPANLLKAGCVGTGCTFDVKTFADAWTYWELTSDTFGLGAHSMDMPDLSTGKNFLYMSVDQGGGGALTVRIPLSQIAASTTINMDYFNSGANDNHTRVTRNTGTEAYWAAHKNTSHMTIFSWKEVSNLIYSRIVKVASWDSPTTTPFSSITPDNQNWLSFLQSHGTSDKPVGATISGNNLWFAWTAPGAPGIPYPHIRLAQLKRANFSVIANDAIWNANYAYAYGYLNTNANGEVGMSFGWGGGGTQYVNSGVAFLTGTRHFVATAIGNAGTTRYGDYLGIRVDSKDTKCFVTAGMAIISSTVCGSTVCGDLVYSEFGRQGDCVAGQ